MRDRVLQFLACPDCHHDLELRDAERDAGRVRTGSLRCGGCKAVFPVREFIPRFVATDRYVDTFSFEWNRFHDVQMDLLNDTKDSEQTFRAKTGWRPEDLRGRTVLDVGVGAGRFADVASRWGAEVVGVDLSFAVDAAYGNIGARDGVHLIQADLFHLPLRREAFDRVYAIGVLHHTPDTAQAFRALLPCVRRQGMLAIFVYAHGPYHYFSDVWRRLTVRLPVRWLYWLSAVAVPLYFLGKVPLVGRAAQFLLPVARWPDWRWRWLDTFDWYSPRYQWKHTWPEVYGWFQRAGFRDIELYQQDREASLAQICMRGTRP